ncbi:hypothetical protein KAR91_21290 [Candidatus Pacearchaeota archaeon]|nr:hypothetical protein [Candidatus Pacearchaeota archaeon]
MANDFSKEERVAFEEILQGFDDALVLSRNVNIYNKDDQTMQRAQNTIWRPQPYIAESVDGSTSIASAYKDVTQLSVPVTIDTTKTVPWKFSAEDLRDSLIEGSFGKAAKQKLASDINVALMNVAANQGTLVVARTVAPTGFDDVAECEAAMNELGVEGIDRYLALATRDYNGMAGNLAGRQNLVVGKTLTAYERAYVGQVASFETYKLDYANTLVAKTAVTVTVNGADQYHTPKGTDDTQTGQINFDNRTQELILAVTSGTVAVGDCFTIAGVYSVHMITKQDTGQLKTFRITSLLASAGASGTMQISPAIVSDGGATDAEAAYKNVTATPASGAALVFLNTVTASINPFWHKDALEIIPGRLAIQDDGASVISGVTDQGLQVTLTKQWDIDENKNKYRLDTLFGVANKAPEMSGVMIFRQT